LRIVDLHFFLLVSFVAICIWIQLEHRYYK
jgi:hypothetical protein